VEMTFPLRREVLRPWQLEMLSMAGVPGILVPAVEQRDGMSVLVYSHPGKRTLEELLEGSFPVVKKLELLSGVHNLASRMEREYFLPRELISYDGRHIFADRDGSNPVLLCVPDNRTSFGELAALVLGEDWTPDHGGPLNWDEWGDFLKDRIRELEITVAYPGGLAIEPSAESKFPERREQLTDFLMYGIFTEAKYAGVFLLILFLLGLAAGFSG